MSHIATLYLLQALRKAQWKQFPFSPLSVSLPVCGKASRVSRYFTSPSMCANRQIADLVSLSEILNAYCDLLIFLSVCLSLGVVFPLIVSDVVQWSLGCQPWASFDSLRDFSVSKKYCHMGLFLWCFSLRHWSHCLFLEILFYNGRQFRPLYNCKQHMPFYCCKQVLFCFGLVWAGGQEQLSPLLRLQWKKGMLLGPSMILALDCLSADVCKKRVT